VLSDFLWLKGHVQDTVDLGSELSGCGTVEQIIDLLLKFSLLISHYKYYFRNPYILEIIPHKKINILLNEIKSASLS
jgi:hypothetical protein